MNPITTVAQFQAVLAGGGAILITDTATGNKVHVLPCPHVKQEYFEQKVIENHGKNGRYFGLAAATPLPAGATAARCVSSRNRFLP